MYKALFRNSRIALLFAAMTLFSAVTMVGTSEDGGTLVDLVNLTGEVRAQADAAAATAAAPTPTESSPPVFGDYDPAAAAAAEAVPPVPGPDTAEGHDPQDAQSAAEVPEEADAAADGTAPPWAS